MFFFDFFVFELALSCLLSNFLNTLLDFETTNSSPGRAPIFSTSTFQTEYLGMPFLPFLERFFFCSLFSKPEIFSPVNTFLVVDLCILVTTPELCLVDILEVLIKDVEVLSLSFPLPPDTRRL
jgi:hypothetical protein